MHVIFLFMTRNYPVAALSTTTMCKTFHLLTRLINSIVGRSIVFASILSHGMLFITRIIAHTL